MTMKNQAAVRVVDHPLIQHKLTLMRARETSTAKFRQLMHEIGLLLGYEATRDLPLTRMRIETPLAVMDAPVLAGKKLCILSIMRAGDGLLGAMLELIPAARVGHIGLYRDPATLVPVEYYFKVPGDIAERDVIIVDPMLATGHSAGAAIARMKQCGVRSITFVCLLAAPEGLAALGHDHPDVPVLCAAIDTGLDAHAYITPGLGDAGDRLFGTK